MISERDAPLALVLIGVSGSGKSTVGLTLATALGAIFLEGDSLHPPGNIAKMRTGTPLDDADRWPWLESIGREIRMHAASGRSVVVACSALRRPYRDALCRAALRPLTFIHLATDAAILATRVRARPQHFMPPTLLRSQIETFEPLQDDEDGTDIHELVSPDQATEAIRRWLVRDQV